MKKTVLAVTFLAMGSVAGGVSAFDNVKMQGSGSGSRRFTLSLISANVCPGSVGIVYNGNGAAGGEMNLINSALGVASQPQTTSPMSRFLSGSATIGVCQADTSRAEGIAYASEAVGLALSRVHLACDPGASAPPTGNSTADCASKPPTGLRSSGVLGTGYVLGGNPPSSNIQGWRDVLRLVYLGLPNSAGKDPAIPTALANNNRNCNSPERQELVNHWGSLFETSCATGNCTQLNHAWRRDLLSDSGDVFRELINAKLYPFCNVRFSFDAQPTLPANPATKLALYPSATVRSDGSPIFEETYQDFDPIRRACVGGAAGQGGSLPAPDVSITPPNQPDFPLSVAEQVCGAQGNLGVVLPIRPPVFGGQTLDQLYPTAPCLLGELIFGAAPKIPGTSNATLCPNGDVTFGNDASDYDAATGIIKNSSNVCLIPATKMDDARCINGANNFNAPIDPPAVGAIPGNRRDGRVYNLHLYNQFGGYRLDSELGPVRTVVGNFSRIHTTRTLLAAAPSCPGVAGDQRCCAQVDPDAQLGCLSEADQCSFGFAGGGAAWAQQLTTSAGTERVFASSINDIKYDAECIDATTYPLSRRLYFNTLIGFENVTGQELSLARCFSGQVAGGPTQFASLLAASGLFALSTGPVCQDFANENCASNNTPSNACANNGAVNIPQ